MEHEPMTSREAKTREAGSTLVELLLYVAITGVILGSITAAFAVVGRNAGGAADRLKKSHDAQVVAQFVVADAQNSGGPAEVSTSDVGSCSDSRDSRVPSPVLRLNWNKPGTAPTPTAMIVNYVLVGNAPGPNGEVSSTLLRRECSGGSLVSDTPVARNVATASAACSPVPDCSGTPTKVTLTVQETVGRSQATPYQYSLAAAFRKVSGGTPPLQPPAVGPAPALFVLGSGGLSLGNGDLTIRNNGGIVINADVSVRNNGHILAQNGTAYTNVDYAGSCADKNGECGTWTDVGVAAQDPYKGMVPDTTGLNTYIDGIYHGPGIYTTKPLNVSGIQMASGTYIINAGFNGDNVTSALGGVLLYVKGGSLSFGGNSALSLDALQTGPFKGVVVYAPATTLTLNGNPAVSFGGAVIIDQLVVKGNPASLAVG
jgi:hypothetical protein